MSKLKINEIYYWNTTGAYNTNISLKCVVLDIGLKYVWVMVSGNLSPTPVNETELTEIPLYKVTNKEVN